MRQLQDIWSNLTLRSVCQFLLQRPSPATDEPHVRLVIDEAHTVIPAITDMALTLWTTGRSRNISLVVCTQNLGTIVKNDPDLLPVILGNSPTKFIGRLDADDARVLARAQTPSPGVDESIGEVQARFLATVTSLPDREFIALTPGERRRFRSMDLDVDGWDKAFKDRACEIEAVKARFALPPDDGLAPVTLAQASMTAATPLPPVANEPDEDKEASPWG